VQRYPKPDTPLPAAAVVKSSPPSVVLEIPKEVAADDVVAPESPVAPTPSNVVTPSPSAPVMSGIPEVALDLGDIPPAAIAKAALAAFAAGTFLMRGRPEVSEEKIPSTPAPNSPSLADLSSFL
jgi:hypothetical protein